MCQAPMAYVVMPPVAQKKTPPYRQQPAQITKFLEHIQAPGISRISMIMDSLGPVHYGGMLRITSGRGLGQCDETCPSSPAPVPTPRR